ncbi:sugar ABC transporter permease [Carboxydochorda subterranea]|uniref:Sugar ABC transporter permease n=1 Tax=Carboxydichorda subterranea TaxID=3109565 RepID=A0ABZ1BXF0_9FIRM|nr:sugar ABC transporter permease [Limnochorda sp. L945t]WRP17447.1 sugar ABC transporter permease [Limnochorda sp. L945t]
MVANQHRRDILREVYRARYIYLLLLPTVVLVGLFQYFPALSAVYYSLFHWDGTSTWWAGWDNYLRMFRERQFITSVVNMLKLTGFSVLVGTIMPLFVAVLIHRLRSARLEFLYRVAFVLPTVVPGVVTILLWKYIYRSDGLLNAVLQHLGLAELARPWLGDFDMALYALMFMGFPWVSGINVLIYSAGLQSIPDDVVDAAVIDGVNPLQMFSRIELPYVLGQLKLVLILGIIGGFQGYVTPLLMTNGGPGWATQVPALRMYQAAAEEQLYGYASAIGVVLFTVVLGMTLLSYKLMRSSVEYEGTRV